MLNTVSTLVCHLNILFGERSVQILCPFLKLRILIFLLRVIYIFYNSPSPEMSFANIFPCLSSHSFLKIFYFYSMCMSPCVYVCMCTYACSACRVQKRALDSLRLELQMVGSYFVGARDQIRVI